MKIFFIVFISLTSSLLSSQNVDEEKLEQLSTAISEETCSCVQKIKEKDGDWVNSTETCFLESFKKNELKIKQLLGAGYLDEENGPNILQIIRNTENYWTSTCLDKIKSEEAFTLNLVYYFNENVNLTYDLTSLIDDQSIEGVEEIQEAEFEVVFVKSYQDEEKDTHVVIKVENDRTFDLLVFDEYNSIMPLLNQNQIKANQKIKITVRQIDFIDEVTGEKLSPQVLVNLQKI